MRTFFRFISTTLVIVFTLLAILIYTFWYQLLSPQVYKDAFNENGVYTQLTGISQDYAAFALTSVGTDVVTSAATALFANIDFAPNRDFAILQNALINAAASFIEENSSVFVKSVSESVGLEQKIQLGTENAIDASVSWFSGQTPIPAYFEYIPSTQELETLNQLGIVRFGTLLIVDGISGYSKLPVCETPEQVLQNVKLVEEVGYQSLNCRAPAVTEAFKANVEDFLPQNLILNIESSINTLVVNNNLEPAVQSIQNFMFSLAQTKEFLIDGRMFVAASLEAVKLLLIFSIPFLILAIALTKRGGRFVTFLSIYFSIGVSLLAFALLYNLLLVDVILNSIGLATVNISSEAISTSRNILFVQSLDSAIRQILIDLSNATVEAGIVITVVTGIPLLFMYLLEITHTEDGKYHITWDPRFEEMKQRRQQSADKKETPAVAES